jgi:hypothetical protein
MLFSAPFTGVVNSGEIQLAWDRPVAHFKSAIGTYTAAADAIDGFSQATTPLNDGSCTTELPITDPIPMQLPVTFELRRLQSIYNACRGNITKVRCVRHKAAMTRNLSPFNAINPRHQVILTEFNNQTDERPRSSHSFTRTNPHDPNSSRR